MRAELLPRERAVVIAGAGLCAVVLLSALISPRPVLTGWLAGAVAFGALPSGALILLMMMRLIPGTWGEDLRLAAEAATLLTPLAALLMLPVMAGMAFIYPWVGDRSLPAFQLWWLAPAPFFLRFILRFGVQWRLGRRMRHRLKPSATASAGLVLMPILTGLVAVDWLMSLDPGFASSAFGLQFLMREVMMAFSALLFLRLLIGRTPPRPQVLGALLLTLLLLSAYFLFLPFFVIWSSDLAPNVAWYAARWDRGWNAVVWGFSLLGGIPLLALLFGAMRASPRWLIRFAICVLASSLLQLGWFVLPGRGGVAVIAYLAAVIGLGLVAAGSLPYALRLRVHARMPVAARS